MNLASWLEYIQALHPREIELGLERVSAVAARLGPACPGTRVITVGGTNGKGSCVAMLEALLMAHGFRVGSYTSPHIHRYNERIRIHGEEASDAALCEAFQQVETARQGTRLTYFEFGTLAALILLAKAKLDFVVLEVGLGGRLDAVNIIAPDVAIITSIDLDHTDWLGPTREEIGREKAGIMRPGKPALCADHDPPRSLLDYAAELAATLLLIGRDFSGVRPKTGGWQFHGRGSDEKPRQMLFRNVPRLHEDGAAAAIQALLLLGLELDAGRTDAVLAQACLPGRFEHIHDADRNRHVLFDVAHNPAAATLLSHRLRDLKRGELGHGRILAVVAIMADKDVEGFLLALDSAVDIWYIAQVNLPRCMPARELAARLRHLRPAARIFEFSNPGSAYESACEEARLEDLILVTGSFYTVAELRRSGFGSEQT